MAWSQKKQNYVDEYLATHNCVDCNEDDIRVLEFDHIDPNTKIGNIALCVRSMGIDRLKQEIEKCEIRCANCHSIKHYKDRRKER